MDVEAQLRPDTTPPGHKPTGDVFTSTQAPADTISSSFDSEATYTDAEPQAPHIAYLSLFTLFLTRISLFAFGGSAAQINLLIAEIIYKRKWLSRARFQRAIAIYQIVPGPEVVELCVFLGCVVKGWKGGVIAGTAFVFPGILMMLLVSYVYTVLDIQNMYVAASLRGMKAVVAALILRALYNMSEYMLVSPHSAPKTDPCLLLLALQTLLNTALHLNLLISLVVSGILYTLLRCVHKFAALALFIGQYLALILYIVYKDLPPKISFGLHLAPEPTLPRLLLLGIVTGSLSFGGAYTAIPLNQVEIVTIGGWLSQSEFTDAIALSSLLPAPVVIFVTFLGFRGAWHYYNHNVGYAILGGILMSLGMFIPSFLFALGGHGVLDRITRVKAVARCFEGICAATIGVVAVVALQILRAAIEGGKSSDGAMAAVLYVVSLGVLFKYESKYTAVLMILSGAVVGQFLFLPEV